MCVDQLSTSTIIGIVSYCKFISVNKKQKKIILLLSKITMQDFSISSDNENLLGIGTFGTSSTISNDEIKDSAGIEITKLENGTTDSPCLFWRDWN